MRSRRTIERLVERHEHTTTLDWNSGAFSPNEVRLIVRIARRHGFEVSFESFEGAAFVKFVKTWP